jgi:hypothetical protein
MRLITIHANHALAVIINNSIATRAQILVRDKMFFMAYLSSCRYRSFKKGRAQGAIA